ncbi:MAG: hypothetical protein ACI9BV_001188 [Rhodothermales bacterium]|jgi:hypothetical protein
MFESPVTDQQMQPANTLLDPLITTHYTSLFLVLSVAAQAPQTEHTLSLTDSTAGMGMGLDALSLMVGTWTGEGFGGSIDEIWTGAGGGQMHGLFRIVEEDGVVLSEHMVIDLADGRPSLRVKHFSPSFEGWEEKEASVTFPLIRAEADTLFFGGLTIVRLGDDALKYYLAMGSADGYQEMELNYTRVK